MKQKNSFVVASERIGEFKNEEWPQAATREEPKPARSV